MLPQDPCDFFFPEGWGTGLGDLRAESKEDTRLPDPRSIWAQPVKGRSRKLNFLSNSFLFLPNTPGSWVQM